MPTGRTLQTGCHVPKPRIRGVGDVCNREMGETSGTRLSETTPCCLWSQVDTRKEDQTSLCVPVRPTQELSSRTQREKMSVLLQECSTHFYVGEGDPTPQYHALFSNFSTLFMLVAVVSFLLFVTCQCVIPFMLFCFFLMCCWCISHFHTSDVHALGVKVLSY